jgi:RND superfamily putative drug exporter
VTWIIGVIALAFVGFRFGAASDNDFTGGDSGSAKAQALIEQHFPEQQGDTLTLAIKSEKGIDDPAARQKIEKVIAELDASSITGPVTSPYDDEQLVTEDRRIARTTIPLTDQDVKKTEVKPLVTTVKDASGDGVTLGLGGDKAEKAETPPQGPAESIGVLAAAVILFIAFGSLVAMGLPIVTALMAILGGIALIKLAGHIVPSPDFTVLVAALIGLGVGIDYALFIVTRYREGLAEGDEPEAATVRAITTAGHAVLFAGTTVVIALLGLITMGQRLMTGVAVGASVTVLVTMIAAVTLLPAFLGFTGYKINSLRLPRRTSRKRRTEGVPSRERRTAAERWAGVVQRKPLLAAVLAGAGLLVLAAPALSMRLSLPDASVQPRDRSSYTSYEILSEGFGPGYGAPLVFAAEVDSQGAGLGPVVEAVRKTEGVAYATEPRVSEDLPGLPQDGIPGRGDRGPRARTARRRAPPGVRRRAGAHRRPERRRDRLRRGDQHPSALDGRGGHPAVPAPARGAGPVGHDRPPGRRHEPPLDRRRLRCAGGGRAVGLARLRPRVPDRDAGHHMGADDDVPGPVRSVDGLRGLPDLTGPRGVRANR